MGKNEITNNLYDGDNFKNHQIFIAHNQDC